jgi:hypothetical protein
MNADSRLESIAEVVSMDCQDGHKESFGSVPFKSVIAHLTHSLMFTSYYTNAPAPFHAHTFTSVCTLGSHGIPAAQPEKGGFHFKKPTCKTVPCLVNRDAFIAKVERIL